MKHPNPLSLLGLFLCISSFSTAQPVAVNDTVCATASELNYNVLSNDIYSPTDPVFVFVLANDGDQCIHLDQEGNLSILDPTCCGEFRLVYMLEGEGAPSNNPAEVYVKIICPKPDCSNIDLTSYTDPQNTSCIAVCENTLASYHIDDLGFGTYSWSVTGGVITSGQGTTEIQVQWNGSGQGQIILSGPLGLGDIIICVDILSAPIADISGDTYVCLGNPANFSGSGSVGATSYAWDFGDSSPLATGQNVSHSYTSPGNYQVSLIVTGANTTADGSPSCCCTDTTFWNITVDSLPGPKIYCVSTLCEGDETKYWTDAACANYNWTLSSNGIITAGQGTDTICVTWTTGPVGTVTLDVNPCAGYCTQPTTVNIPIIPSSTSITGPAVVCVGSTEIYSVPKWPGTVYTWNVSPDGQVVSQNGGHTVSINWVSAGPRTITVSYSNTFLQGLPGHDDSDCMGLGTLDVLVKPRFNFQAPNPSVVCTGDAASYSISPAGAYTWSISPSTPFSGQGTASISLNWNVLPGSYTISAVPVDTTLYCNSLSSITIQVVDIAKPTSISGETSICAGDSYLYQVQSNDVGTTFNWQVNNGTPTSGNGTELNVTWGPTGPYWVSVSQTMGSSPFCTSDTIMLMMSPKLLLPLGPISGSDGCVNTVQTYSVGPLQHPDAEYSWTLSDSLKGSVISLPDSSSVDIQWNNTSGPVTLTVSVTVCGVTLTQTKTVNLAAATQPVITSSGYICSGGVTLCVNNVTVVAWSGGNTPNSACTTVSSAGQYTVTTTDSNGCPAIGIVQVTDNGAPIAQISAPATEICTANGDPNESRSIFAISSPNSTYAWFCDNGSGPVLAVPQPSNPEIFIHTETGVDGNYAYYAIVTENTTGCSKQSNTVVIHEYSPCGEPGPPCDSLQTYNLSFLATDNNPICNIIDVNVTASSNVTLQSWNFGDPLNNINNFTSLDPAQHTYTNAGYYPITLTATVPRNTVPVTSCLVSRDTIVCIPVGADFNWSSICSTVNVSQMASLLTGFSISGYQWDFGDFSTATGPTASHTYLIGGTYNVKLIVTTTSGCTAEVTKSVTVAGDPVLGIGIAPAPPYCEGDALAFSGTGSNIISWLWSFGDASQNGAQNASHAYLNSGSYTVTLTGTDSDGCVGSTSQSLTIHPAPLADTISYTSPLTFCHGDSVLLIAPTCSGCTYLWSNGSTASSIWVNSAGEISVTVMDSNGCSYTTPNVVTNVLGLPNATIMGNPVICDQGTTTLSVPAGTFSYSWSDASSSVVGTGNSVVISASLLNSPYSVLVTSSNGCTASSSILVTTAVSPSFTVAISPDPCAGTPSTLSVTPVQSNVTYQWNNGIQGPILTTSIAGTYTAIGTDTISGCSSSASGTIHPQPELCSFPTGCYDICAPDTVCGPDGLASYQWFLDGSPFSSNQCIELNTSGTYTLTAINSFGCSNTSDELILNVVPCDDCDLVDIAFDLVIEEGDVENPCCAILDYSNNWTNPLTAIQIHTVNADLSYSNLSSSFTVTGSTSSSVDLAGNPSSGSLPNGNIIDFIQTCIINPTSNPQLLIIDWYDAVYEVVCSDTLTFNCPIEPECLYLASDSIHCEGTTQVYDVTLCNPISNTYPVYYVELVSGGSASLVPSSLLLTTPIYPGQCQSFSFTLGGTYVPGDTLCYTLFAHNADPNIVDTALCCSTLEQYCVIIPDCDPCDDVSIIQEPSEDCCLNWSIVNGFQDGYFDGIDICVITPNSTLTINNTIGSGWQTTSNNGIQISLDKKPLGSYIGPGTHAMPELCMTSSAAPNQLVEIKWMQGDSIVCRDTLSFNCPPPCGYIEDEIECLTDGSFNYIFNVTNTSGFTMDHGVLVVTSPPSSGVNQTYQLGALATGNTSGNFILNLPQSIGNPGDTICFTFALHEVGQDEFHINCCNFQHCFVIPDCGPAPDCVCDDEFLNTPSSVFDQSVFGNQVTFFPTNGQSFNSACDVFHWNWGDGNESLNQPSGSISHTYAGPGTYQVCVNVVRTTPNGLCELIFCYDVFIQQLPDSCDVSDPAYLATDLDVVEIDFGTNNPRVNATWTNPNNTTECEVRGGRIAPSSINSGAPVFANMNNTRIINQTNGSTVVFNIILYNNPNIPFVIGQTYGFEVRCLCEDGSAFMNWSGITSESTFIVPAPPAPLQGQSRAEAKMSEELSITAFPNPSDGKDLNVMLHGEDLEHAFIRILDMNGRLISESRMDVDTKTGSMNLRFDSELSKGLYILQVYNDKAIISERFTVE